MMVTDVVGGLDHFETQIQVLSRQQSHSGVVQVYYVLPCSFMNRCQVNSVPAVVYNIKESH